MRVETITHPSGEQIPILLDMSGLPISAPNEFVLGRRASSTHTLIRNLRELSVFYRWLERQSIDLWERIENGKFFSEAELKGSLIEALRRDQCAGKKVARLTISPDTFNQRLTTVRQYLRWCFDLYLSQLPLTDIRYERLRDHGFRNIKWLDSSFMSASPVKKGNPKALNDQQIRNLIQCLEPESSDSIGRNPAVKFRNYISTLLMLYCGLRPGELLSLRVEDIELGSISGVHVRRRSPDPNDNRKPRPRIKRNGRLIPIVDSKFARSLNEYIMTWRSELESDSAVDTDYLILSDEGFPLSHPSLNLLYEELRRRFPSQLPQHLTARALRHTFSSKMEQSLRNAGLAEERRRQALAVLRGDSSLESQSVYISQEIEDQANIALKNYQKKLLSSGAKDECRDVNLAHR